MALRGGAPESGIGCVTVTSCVCCGSRRLAQQPVLWPDLIREWDLSPEEAAYVDRQQGLACRACGASLRSMALAFAVMRSFGFDGTFDAFVGGEAARALSVLEINPAGGLAPFLSSLARHTLAEYPSVDMTTLPFAGASFDLVIHSDTLEHVPRPVQGLRECRRVLRAGGRCAFTVPMIVGRLTRSRDGLPASFHGTEDARRSDFLVHTEYGADAWTHVVQAGFAECRLYALEYPAAHALVAVS
jgi:SAM-dependent methyltransferase